MSDSTTAAVQPMNAVDYLLFRGDANPRTRAAMVGVEYLERSPEWERLTEVFERTSRVVPRLRQKVVVPSLPTSSPCWVTDPDFDLAYHLRRVRLRPGASHRELLDFAERFIQAPLDAGRALWEAVLVEDLEDGKAALLTKQSHAVSDGLGGVRMAEALYDLEPDAPRRPAPPLPPAEDLSSLDLARQGIGNLPRRALGHVGGVTRKLGGALLHPVGAVKETSAFAGSAGRVLRPSDASPSPLLRRRSAASRVVTLDVPLDDMRAAATAAGGSVNDVYLAALSAALRIYHDKLGVAVSRLPMAVPVSLRREGQAATGNHFAGVLLAAPIEETDPAARVADVRRQVIAAREERAIGIIGNIAPVLSVLPGALLDTLNDAMPLPDVQASNVPSYTTDTFIAGVRVERQYPIGPLPGVALMVVLISRAGMCYLGARYDTASITDGAAFEQALREGFDETLSLAGDRV
jgi:WS/DGAT/MGAT family acyltransferase